MASRKPWTPETASSWLNINSPYFASMTSQENRRAIASLVANIWNSYGLKPIPGPQRKEGGNEPNLVYDPSFVSFELRTKKAGFRLLVRGPREAYKSIVQDQHFVRPRGKTPRIEVNRPIDDLNMAWAAIQVAAEIDKLAPKSVPPPDLIERITVDPKVCGGRPCIRHLRIRVTDVLDMIAGGASESEILQDYPYLEEADLRACLAFAARWLDHPVLRAS